MAQIRHVVFHLPGPNWKSGENFQGQSEEVIMQHVQYYAKYHE